MRATLPASLFHSLGFAAALFATASVAQACGGGPPDSASTLPGIGFLRPDVMLLLPILSGTIERPFYSLAGYRTQTLGYSIEANLLGALAANVAGLFGLIVFDFSPMMLGVFGGVSALSMIVKQAWFSRVPREPDGRSPMGMFALATILSTLIIASLPLWMHLFGTDTPSYAMQASALRAVAIVGAAVVTIGTHLYLFTTVRRPSEMPDRRRGFDVLPADSVPLATPAPATT